MSDKSPANWRVSAQLRAILIQSSWNITWVTGNTGPNTAVSVWLLPAASVLKEVELHGVSLFYPQYLTHLEAHGYLINSQTLISIH